MYALRERRVHVTQEDFEMAVAKVQLCSSYGDMILMALFINRLCKRTQRKTCPLRNSGNNDKSLDSYFTAQSNLSTVILESLSLHVPLYYAWQYYKV